MCFDTLVKHQGLHCFIATKSSYRLGPMIPDTFQPRHQVSVNALKTEHVLIARGNSGCVRRLP